MFFILLASFVNTISANTFEGNTLYCTICTIYIRFKGNIYVKLKHSDVHITFCIDIQV